MLRVLHIIEKMDRGGAETLIMNLYKEIDRSRIQFDFLVHDSAEGHFDEEIIKMGGRIFPLPKPSSTGIKKYQKLLLNSLREYGPFSAVHSHIHFFSGIIMQVAKKSNIPVRIAHSHTSVDFKAGNILRYFYTAHMRYLINKNATKLFYCSETAGEALFGTNYINDSRSVFIPNSVKLEKFSVLGNEEKKIIRKKLGFPENKKIIGHVGSFTTPKNHTFLIDVFSELVKNSDGHHLILVGGGPLRDEIENKVKKLNLNESVTFYGVTDNVPLILQAFDSMLFPSLFEGLPTVIVEAQASGLPCIISNTITNEVNMDLGLIEKADLKADINEWLNKISAINLKKIPTNSKIKENINKKGFETSQVAKFCELQYGAAE